MKNFEQTIISQYANSSAIYSLIESMNQWIDPRNDINNFYNMIWNIDTARGFGLDIWGKIVVIGRTIKVLGTDNTFGFKTGYTAQDFRPFGQAPFSSSENRFSYYTMADSAYRSLIMIKAMINIIYATAPAINALLSKLFEGRGRCYFLALGNMSARYVFEFYLEGFERALLLNSDFLPNPSGVELDFREIVPDQTFGFSEAKSYQPFGHGSLFYRD